MTHQTSLDDLPPADSPVAPVGEHHPATAREAARSVLPRAGSHRRRIYMFVVGTDGWGATDDEIETAFGMRHQTASAARNSLVHDGWLHDSGQRRPTRSGRDAIVWRARTGG